MKGPVVLIIRDGWGHRMGVKNNAIVQGNTLNTDRLMREYPQTLIGAAGLAVGLPAGYQGNSEVGHMTIGAGRIIKQSLVRINESIKKGDFEKNETFLEAIDNAKKHGTALHLVGLLQTEGVHSHMDHLFALLDLCKDQEFYNVHVHVITDGRDAPPKMSIKKLKKLTKKLKKLSFGSISTISGRYYSMDRDKRWDRTRKAYDCIVLGQAGEYENGITYLKESYKKEKTDEFLEPRKAVGYKGIQKNDSIIFYNYRTDRPRQLTQAIVEDKFDGWERTPSDVYFVAMTQYYKPMKAHVAFPDTLLTNLLGEVVSKSGMKQLRISETEKYAHVTFFFNGQNEESYEGEDRILIPSPKVATYDLKPEMSAYEVTDRLIEELDKDHYDLIVVNLVNGDMVGHTGVWEACLKAVETVDNCVERLVTKILEKKGVALVFADHGNIEDLSDKWGTSHTTNDVSFILISPEGKNIKIKQGGGLQDIAPTALDLLDIEKPEEMTGKSMVKKSVVE